MLCLRCHPDLKAGSADSTLIDVNDLGPTSICGLCYGTETASNSLGEWPLLENYLKDENQEDGWHMVTNEKHMLAHRVLSQVIYRYLEPPNREKNEVDFAIPDPDDIVFLCWSENCAVGFCSLKPKGSPASLMLQQYAITTLDTVFIRAGYRRNGLVSRLLQLLASHHEDLGFSQPISDTMLKVIAKFLSVNKQYRRTFWEVTDSGGEGNRKLIWFQLKRLNQLTDQIPLDHSTCRMSAVKSGSQIK